jgi:hypothetical protein
MEGAVAKALEVNDGQNQERETGQQPGKGRNKQKLQGKALQVNEDTKEGQEPIRPPRKE